MQPVLMITLTCKCNQTCTCTCIIHALVLMKHGTKML